MAKVNFNSFSSLSNSSSFLSRLNQNFSRLSSYLDDTVSRSGVAPNTMLVSLDTNNNRIINLPKPLFNSEPVRLQDLNDIYVDLQTIDQIRDDLDQEVVDRQNGDSMLATLIAGGVTTNYNFYNKAAATASNISVLLTSINVLGYYKPFDNGQGVYTKVLSEPAHNGKIHSADGAWWELQDGCTPEQFGAYGDWIILDQTGHDDTQAFNDLFEYGRLRATISLSRESLGYGFNGFTRFSVSLKSGAVYMISSTINMTTQDRGWEGTNIYGNGALIYPIFSENKPVWDATGSRGFWVHDLLIFADDPALLSSVAPNYGFVQARHSDLDVSGSRFSNVQIRGFFTHSAFLNISAEITLHEHCTYHNHMQAVSADVEGHVYEGNSYFYSDHDIPTFESEFVTYTPRTLYFGCGNNIFIQTHFQNELGIPINLADNTGQWSFINCYGYTQDSTSPIIYLGGEFHIGLNIQIHGEGTGPTLVGFNNSANIVECRGFTLIEDSIGVAYGLLGALVAIGDGGYRVSIFNGDVRLSATHRPENPVPSIRLVVGSDWLQYGGVIKTDEADPALYDMEAFNLFLGRWETQKTTADALTNKPTTGWMRFEGLTPVDIIF